MPLVIIGALIIGLTLGLMGSGGSILTVPVLVYVVGHDGKVAIAESLAIVGGIALITMIPYMRSNLVNWRHVVFFGVPGMAGTYVGAWLSRYISGTAQLTFFAIMMLIASAIMFRKPQAAPADQQTGARERDLNATRQVDASSRVFWLIGLEGLAVGIITGLVGVGGGFLIVPALVVFGKLPMRVAVGTSLAVISLKSFSGFYKYLDVLHSMGRSVDWQIVGAFVLVGVVGSFAGHWIAGRLNQQVLRRAFAVFLIGMGVFVLGKETTHLLGGRKFKSQAAATVFDAPRCGEKARCRDEECCCNGKCNPTTNKNG